MDLEISGNDDLMQHEHTPLATSDSLGVAAGGLGSRETFAIDDVDDPETERRKLEEAARTFLIEQTHQVIIPSYSAWFNMAKINSIETKSLPEFFNGRNRSKTPSIFKDYRDFMINTYRLNPIEYLTVTACRRNLAGDVCAVMRVHAFLEQWGLINYQIAPESRPSTISPPFTGHFRVTADTPRGLQPLQPCNNSTSTKGKPLGRTTNLMSRPPQPGISLELRRNVYDSTYLTSSNGVNMDSSESHKQYNCFTCGVDCSRLRYHSIKQKKYDLCSSCYEEGRFPSTSHSGDFVKMDGLPPMGGNAWTDSETLLLLEGLEMFDEDWDQIADHIGSKSREQCVLQFLQLPIEDSYLEGQSAHTGPLQHSRTPYSQADNPVISVAAFLASAVRPEVALASAQSAIREMTKELSQSEQHNSGFQDVKADVKTSRDTSKDQVAMERVAGVALGTAAAKAHLLASCEQTNLTSAVSRIVKLQMEKLDTKLAQFNELERVLEADRRQLEASRQQIYLDRLALKKQVFTVQDQLQIAINVGGQQGYQMALQANQAATEGNQLQEGHIVALTDPIRPLSEEMIDIPFLQA